MSKRRESQSLVKSTAGALPWLTIARVAMVVSRHWNALSAKERARLAQLVGESRGRVGNLSGKQRSELAKLARKLDLKGLGRELWPLVRGGRGRRGRRGRR
ncbi:MAG TPA: hypothetical protein VL988_06525 [Solirubrobacteraceae bacterium]|nr:hypothetical protein [Solirubrobacteraceae bacterium]